MEFNEVPYQVIVKLRIDYFLWMLMENTPHRRHHHHRVLHI